MLAHHVLPALERLCQAPFNGDAASLSSFTTLLCTLTWSISNMCRRTDTTSAISLLKCIRCATKHKQMKQLELDEEASRQLDCNFAWSVAYLVDNRDFAETDPLLRAIHASGVSKDMIGMMHVPHCQQAALRTVGSVMSGNDRATQTMIDLQVLPAFRRLLAHVPSTRKEICWAISNVTAGTPQQVEAVAKAGIFPLLLRLLATAPCAVLD